MPQLLSILKNCTDSFNGCKLGITDSVRYIFECHIQEVYGVCHSVFQRERRLSEIFMEKFCCVCNKQRFCFSINCLDAPIVVEHRAHTKSFASSLIPGFSII